MPIIKAAKNMMAPVPHDKKGQSGAHGREQLPRIEDPEKAESATIFYEAWQKVKGDKTYTDLAQAHKEKYG
jgi:hypothetical protein